MFSDDSDTEDIHQLTINEHYAKAFEYRKEREELAKLKEKYGSDAEDVDEEEQDSEEDVTEDEDGEELTPAVDAAILRTLARIKRKDPSIYEQGKDVFEEEKARTGEVKLTVRSKQDKSKPLTLKQHALASALNPDSRSPSPQPLTYVEEQEALKAETIKAFHEAVSEDDDNDDLLVLREKTKDELEKEEEEYKAFLEREVGYDLKELITVEDQQEGSAPIGEEDAVEDGDKSKKKEHKKEKKKKAKDSTSKEDEDQQFLLDYILNRGWIDKSSRRLPTYQEITTSSSKKGKERADPDDEDEGDEDEDDDGQNDLAEEDEEFEDIADRFESSYNFRFEEPGATTIARFPRNIASGVRRDDTTRKEARDRRKQRKEEELLQKREEIKRLKALKMKELRGKLEKIGREGGKSLEEEALQVLDLDGDWDPDMHDRQMADLYAQEGDGLIDEDEKPSWDDDIDITDIVPDEESSNKQKKKNKKKKKKKDEEELDEGGVDIDEMDADVEKFAEAQDEEEWDGSEEMRKRALDKYMSELYEMEFNDLVGDIPTRFHYAQVQPSSFALSPVEILLATDAELNQYMGIKKIAPYRDKKREGWDHSRNARLTEFKDKVKGRKWGSRTYDGEGEPGPSADAKPKKRKGKKERMKQKAAVTEQEIGAGDGLEAEDDAQREPRLEVSTPAKTKKRKADDHADDDRPLQETHAADISSKKRKRRHKKSGPV